VLGGHGSKVLGGHGFKGLGEKNAPTCSTATGPKCLPWGAHQRAPIGSAQRCVRCRTPVTDEQLVPTVVIESWQHFMQLITAYLEAGLPYAYRGHADCAWDLRPSLLRIAPSAEATHLLELGKALVTEFKSQAHLALDSRELPQLGEPAAAWWALMQHHGAPTRTLDWTQSAMVAAYFAVERLPDRDGALFLVDIQSINEGL